MLFSSHRNTKIVKDELEDLVFSYWERKVIKKIRKSAKKGKFFCVFGEKFGCEPFILENIMKKLRKTYKLSVDKGGYFDEYIVSWWI